MTTPTTTSTPTTSTTSTTPTTSTPSTTTPTPSTCPTPSTDTPTVPPCSVLTREDILQRHKDEWTRHAVLLDAALADSDTELAKLAKLIAETLRIRQDGERRAWGISDKHDPDLAAPLTLSWQPSA